MDIVAVAVLCVMNTEQSGQITFEEFTKGCDYMKVYSVDKWASAIKELRKKL